jgi:hypothetical protein
LAFRILFYDYRERIWVLSNERSVDCFDDFEILRRQ